MDFLSGGIGAAVGAIVGGGVGFFVGGPAGAAAGAKIGAGIGGVGGSGIAGKDIQDLSTAGYSAQQRAQIAQQRAADKQAEMQKEANRRAVVQQIRTARIQRARTSNLTTPEGVISSGAIGAGYSISQQLGSNLQFMRNQESSLNAAMSYTNTANKELYRAQRASDFINTLNTASSAYQDYTALQRLNTTTTNPLSAFDTTIGQ